MKEKIISSILLIFFVLGYINIQFSILALICYIFAFGILLKTKRKIYCSNYCFRKGIFDITSKIKIVKFNINKFDSKYYRQIVFFYFILSFIILIMPTIAVYSGKIDPINEVRFLFAVKVPFKSYGTFSVILPVWIIHLCYRLYSMTLTTVVLGVLLSILYKPRTWCSICPYTTVANKYIKKET